MHRFATSNWATLTIGLALMPLAWASQTRSCRADDAPSIAWETNYTAAVQQAKLEKKMLLIQFFNEAKAGASEPFLREIESKPELRDRLGDFVLARLPLDAEITIEGKPTRLLNHAAFAELEKHQGIVLIDYANEGTQHYGYVVTALPFKNGKYYRYSPQHVGVLLNLPAGTQTQRALVFAVRIHPEAPASAKGDLDPHLVDEAKRHSQYQAQIRVQGHHHWDARFPRIARLLPFGLRPQEVVAESWPHENMLDAAVDCVASWRQSSGHWGAVKRDQPKFAYDMRRGNNGIWYATGIFGNYN
jgi:hypothetical protein